MAGKSANLAGTSRQSARGAFADYPALRLEVGVCVVAFVRPRSSTFDLTSLVKLLGRSRRNHRYGIALRLRNPFPDQRIETVLGLLSGAVDSTIQSFSDLHASSALAARALGGASAA